MNCKKCENCFRITLNSGGFGVFRRVSSKLSSIWFDSLGNILSDQSKINELDSKAILENKFDCSIMDQSRDDNVIYPMLIDPTASIYDSCSGLYEVGADIALATCFITSFDKGSIVLSGVKQDDRAGSLMPSGSFIYRNNDIFDRELPLSIPLGRNLFRYRAAYNEGPQPFDSFGNKFNVRLRPGFVDSDEVEVVGVAPFYATIIDCTRLDKLPLPGLSDSLIEITLASEVPGKQVFMVPEDRIIDSIFIYNGMTDRFEKTIFENYTETQEVKIFNGVSVVYRKFIHRGYNRSTAIIKIKFRT